MSLYVSHWDVSYAAAEATSALHDPSGVADSTFVWYATRALCRSDIPTGSPHD